ncbi:MAG: C_GCAxxG_C_C family protein [Firmicutes bacterium]|nr:C_GCAxxG_C_C family protein [Bacillota bacterium]
MTRKLEVVLEEVHQSREKGFNCAEGVFWGVSQYLGLSVPVSCMAGFGGGVAGSGSVCGALSGALAAVGVYVGRTDPEDREAKVRATALSKAVAAAFISKMGTQLCREILGYLPGNKPAHRPDGINPKCRKAVTLAVKLAVEAVEKDQQKYKQTQN